MASPDRCKPNQALAGSLAEALLTVQAILASACAALTRIPSNVSSETIVDGITPALLLPADLDDHIRGILGRLLDLTRAYYGRRYVARTAGSTTWIAGFESLLHAGPCDLVIVNTKQSKVCKFRKHPVDMPRPMLCSLMREILGTPQCEFSTEELQRLLASDSDQIHWRMKCELAAFTGERGIDNSGLRNRSGVMVVESRFKERIIYIEDAPPERVS